MVSATGICRQLVGSRSWIAPALLLASSTSALAQAPAERAIYSRLGAKGPDEIKALATVLKKSDEYSALVLYQASAMAWSDKRTEDSAFLFFAAFIRSQFDKALFPAAGKDQADYLGAYSMLRAVIGPQLMPLLYDAPDVFERALNRVEKWQPEAPKGYLPGWKYSAPADPRTAVASIQTQRDHYFSGLKGFCTLLKNDSYRAAFRIAQDNSSTTMRAGDKKPTQEEFEAAVRTMATIEGGENIRGVSAQFRN